MARQRSQEFKKRFRELIAGKTQADVAEELGVGQSTVSNMAAGYPPSRVEVVDRISQKYSVDRDEWLHLAGLADEDPDEARIREVADAAAEKAVDRVLREAPVSAEFRLAISKVIAGHDLTELAERSGLQPGYIQRIADGLIPPPPALRSLLSVLKPPFELWDEVLFAAGYWDPQVEYEKGLRQLAVDYGVPDDVLHSRFSLSLVGPMSSPRDVHVSLLRAREFVDEATSKCGQWQPELAFWVGMRDLVDDLQRFRLLDLETSKRLRIPDEETRASLTPDGVRAAIEECRKGFLRSGDEDSLLPRIAPPAKTEAEVRHEQPLRSEWESRAPLENILDIAERAAAAAARQVLAEAGFFRVSGWHYFWMRFGQLQGELMKAGIEPPTAGDVDVRSDISHEQADLLLARIREDALAHADQHYGRLEHPLTIGDELQAQVERDLDEEMQRQYPDEP